jgi:hypothetical protein
MAQFGFINQSTSGQFLETRSDTGRLLDNPENVGGEGGIRVLHFVNLLLIARDIA